MNKRLGTYRKLTIGGESYKAYIPPQLPPSPPIDLQFLYPYLEKATRKLAELDSIHKSIPNTALFIYMYVRKEALISSQIEGTQSSFSDLILFENNLKPEISIDDVEEVSNYVKAAYYGIDRIKGGFPMSLRLLREMHKILLSGSRGSNKLPGEVRDSQNWIGGTRPGNALFVPPPHDHLMECLSNFEHFLHDDSLPALVRAGIAHVQFETIHPFLDGNGRLGRLLIVLILYNEGLLTEPILYLSLYLKQNRQTYYNLLQEVRINGTWETWLEFFLDGVYKSAKQGLQTAYDINSLFQNDIAKIESLGRSSFVCLRTLEYLKKIPQVTVPQLALALDISAPTARNALQRMERLGILREISGNKRDRIYLYQKYLKILEEGAEPIK